MSLLPGALSRSGDFFEPGEELLFPRAAADSPVHGRTLMPFGIVAFAWIEVAPRYMLGERRHQVAVGIIEAEMVVFVDQHGHGPPRSGLSRGVNHLANP